MVGLSAHLSNAQVQIQVQPVPPLQPGVGKKGEEPAEKDQWTDAMSLPTDRQANERIKAIRIYVNKPNPPWETIIEVVQRLLEADEDSLLEVESKDETGKIIITKVSVRNEVNRLISTFPVDGREFYQNTYGPRAQGKLEDAMQTNNLVLLTEVSQRYLHTKAGADATLILGTVYLDRGLYQQAASSFARYLSRPEGELKDINPKILFKAALAFRRIGDDKQSARVWKQLEDKLNGKGLDFAGRVFTLDQLKVELDRKSELTFASLEGWPLFKGNTARNATGLGGSPFLEPRFSTSLIPQPGENHYNKDSSTWVRENLEQAIQIQSQRPVAAIPAFFPIAAKNRIIFRTYSGVYAVPTTDDKTQDPPVKAGEVLDGWASISKNGLYQMVSDPGRKQLMDNNWWKQWYFPTNGPLGIFFENGLIGTLSHDGTRAYYIDDLAVPPHPNHVQQFQGNFPGQAMAFGAFQDSVFANELIAVDIESGKQMWSLGGKNPAPSADEDTKKKPTPESLLDAIFLGAPLPVAGRLYVLMEKGSNLQLVCIDPAKITMVADVSNPNAKTPRPEICWIQSLGSPNHEIAKDTMRRIQGVNLAFSDGILVVPTNAGVVMGIELLTRSLVWAHSYREATAPANVAGQPGPGVQKKVFVNGQMNNGPVLNLNQERWRSSAPIIVNGKVIFTAYDGASVQCLNLRDGKFIWKSPRSADDLYLAGVHNDKVIIVNKNSMRAIDLNDGKKIHWTLNSGMPAGHGVTGANSTYYLPVKAAPDTKEPEVWAIDLNEGKILSRTKSRKKHAPGNLLFYEGDVYSQTPWELAAYPQLQVKLAEMNRRLLANPQDPIGLTERGELRLDDGQLVAAITDLQDALKFAPPPETRLKARDKLYEALTELLQRDFNSAEKHLVVYKELCEVEVPADVDPVNRQRLLDEQLKRKANFFCLLAKGREKQGKLVEAFDHYMAFGTLTGNQELVNVIDEPNTFSRPDVWARGRIENMIRTADPTNRKPLEMRVTEEWSKIRDANDLERVRNFVKVFGTFFQSGKQARLKLADMLMMTGNEDDMRDSQNILLGLRNAADEDPQLAAQAIETLARMLIRKGFFEDAVGLYTELGTSYAAVVVRDGKTGADFLSDLLTDKRFLPYLEPLREMWHQKLKAEEVPGGQPRMPQTTFGIDPEGEQIPFFKRYRLVMDLNAQGTPNWQMRVVDRVTGEDYWKYFPLPAMQYIYNFPQSQFRLAFVRGHLLLLTLNNEVFAFDLADKKLLWKYNLFGKAPMPNTRPVNTIIEPDGLRLVYPDGWTQKLGQIGVIEASYVCLTTHDGLVAVDPNRGTTLWTKSNVSSRVKVFGDDRHVYIVEWNQDGSPCPTRCVRAQDGVSVDIPDASALLADPQKYRMVGRNLLVFGEQDNKRILRLYDVHTGKDIWRKEFDLASILVRAEDPNLVAIVTPQGDLTVLNVKTTQEVFAAKLGSNKLKQHLDKVNEAVLLSDRERYYLVLNRPVEAGAQLTPNYGAGMRFMKVNGAMYCFDKATKKRLWYTDEQFENQAIILEQFQDLPIIIAAMQYTKFNNGQLESQGVRVVAIDKKTGNARFRRDLSPNSQFYTLESDARTGVIQLWRPDLRIRFAPEGYQGAANIEGPNPKTVPVNAPILRRAPVPVILVPMNQ